MIKHVTLGLSVVCIATMASAQLSFTDASSLMTPSNSGGCMGVVDMNGDGLDDIAKLNNANICQVDYQNPDGSFTFVDYGAVSNAGQWGWAIADIDNNGHKDVLSGGNGDGTHYVRITSPGVSALSNLNGPNIFTQGMSIADVNNDGDLDVFACGDTGPSNLWLTNTSGVPISNNSYINWATNPVSDMSGNYGSCFTDFDGDGDIDLYIAHCRQGVNSPDDPRRWDRLFVNDGNNNYSDQAAEYGVQIRNQTWTTDFGDYDNDGDLDMVATNHDATIQLFENDGNGYFTEVTAGCGMEFNSNYLQSKFVDFDNDGNLDVMVAGGDNFLFMGNGDGTFLKVDGKFPSTREMHSFATGDLNNDGFQDVFANYGSGYITPSSSFPDRLWLNDGNDNHWFTVRLIGTVSNRDAVGARVTITGPWGSQVREVKAGESYGMVTTFACSFGLGAATQVPTVTITWPSGLVETFNDLDADATITVIEGECISPVAVITPASEPLLCGNGDALELSANEGFNYLWSNGATTQTISIDEPGNYSVTIDDGTDCAGNTSLFVAQRPDETPMVTALGETDICAGGTVVLTTEASNSGYSWSTGETTQSITVGTAGSYSVTTESAFCGALSSAATEVVVFATPDAPVAEDVTVPLNSTANLDATGVNIEWFDQAVGGTPVGTGSTFTTPVLFANTTYWVSSTNDFAGAIEFGARANRSTNGQFHTNADNYQIFTANEDLVIRSTKVYANGDGDRTFAVVDQSNGATIATGVFNVPNGESRVDLNFFVPAGGPYGLRAVGGNPQLWRDGTGSGTSYPYQLGTLGSMTSSSATGTNALVYYYFFYDVEVQTPGISCTGPRTQVDVLVGPSALQEVSNSTAITVFPNPTTGLISVGMGEVEGRVSLDVLDVTGRVVLAVNADNAARKNGIVTMDLGKLASGDYTLNVRHQNGSSVHRVVVQ
ncbi:MAG: VCBS repeat-containing protein [Flavobacteriales bacterium]|nr:VCBS repeat-containing protein [Flavobacteriales bacterium]